MVDLTAYPWMGTVCNGYLVCCTSRRKNINLGATIQYSGVGVLYSCCLKKHYFTYKTLFMKGFRRNSVLGISAIIVLTVLTFGFSTCTPWDKGDVKIERFEYLDVHRRSPVAGDSLSSEAYLIHGYNSRYEDEIHKITDQYICDSIIPNRTFTQYKYITFFKKNKKYKPGEFPN